MSGARVLPAGIAAWGARETLSATLRRTRLTSNDSLIYFVTEGLWNAANGSEGRHTGCGAEILAVSPPFDPDNHNTSIALLKLSVVSGGGRAVNTSYFRATVDQECSALQSLELAAAGEFYAALLANAQRWDSFVERGSQLQLPDGDIRYRDTASSLLTMYLNTDRGLRPQYGGEFATTSHVAYFINRLAVI